MRGRHILLFDLKIIRSIWSHRRRRRRRCRIIHTQIRNNCLWKEWASTASDRIECGFSFSFFPHFLSGVCTANECAHLVRTVNQFRVVYYSSCLQHSTLVSHLSIARNASVTSVMRAPSLLCTRVECLFANDEIFIFFLLSFKFDTLRLYFIIIPVSAHTIERARKADEKKSRRRRQAKN